MDISFKNESPHNKDVSAHDIQAVDCTSRDTVLATYHISLWSDHYCYSICICVYAQWRNSYHVPTCLYYITTSRIFHSTQMIGMISMTDRGALNITLCSNSIIFGLCYLRLYNYCMHIVGILTYVGCGKGYMQKGINPSSSLKWIDID